MRVSLYKDDVGLFVCPFVHDISNIQIILQHFGNASKLRVNFLKSELFLISSNGSQPSVWTQHFMGKVSHLPASYLGMPLRIGKPMRGDEQKLVDKIAGRLASW
jgi:hypothetical protein